jgi:hypothetical protein
MTIGTFGKILPIHGSVLRLIGYDLRRGRGPSTLEMPDEQRMAIMRAGLEELKRRTGQNFGFDLRAWPEYLRAHSQEYRHPYAYRRVHREALLRSTDEKYLELARRISQSDEADAELLAPPPQQ